MPVPYWQLSGYYFFYFAFVGAFSPYFGLYLQGRGFSAAEIGLLLSQMQLMRLLAPAAWSWIADQSGQRLRIFRLTSALGGLGFTGVFLADGFAAMLGVIGVMALFWSAAMPLVETLTLDHLRATPARYSRIRVWGSVGFIVATQATGVALDALGLSTLAWIILGILATTGLLAWGIPPAPGHGPDGDGESVPVWAIVRRPEVAALLTACFFMAAAHGALYNFYSIHVAAVGYSKTLVGSLWSLGVLAEIGVFMVMPRVLEHYSLRRVLLVTFAAAVLRFLLIGWGVAFLPLLLLAQCLHALTFAAFHAAAISAIHRWFPGAAQARGQALYSSLSFGAGGLAGGVLAGFAWEGVGPGWTYSLSAAFALVGFVILWRGLPRAAWGRQVTEN